MRTAILAAAISCCAVWTSPAAAEPLRTTKELGDALIACWRPPPYLSGSSATLLFSVNRQGAILGKPRMTYTKVNGDADARARFVASVNAAVAACTPLPFSDALGQAIAGRVFTLRFVAP